jgi:hypothetical protein
MTIIRVRCPSCGEVDLEPDDVMLSIPQGGRGSTYAFTCPACADPVERAADRKTVALLISAGVEPSPMEQGADPRTRPSREEIEPLGSLADAVPFTLDDLIDFHFLLLDEVYVEECLATLRQDRAAAST